jgi:hypothetical protein
MSKTKLARVLWTTTLIPLGMLFAVPAPVRAADGQWQFGSAPSFSSGTYGTDTRTDVLHTPITARRLFEAGDVTLVFPFTCIWGHGDVTVVNGTPVRSDETTSRGAEGPTAGRGASGDSLRSSTGPDDTDAGSCGMGDIVVRGRYYIVDERGWIPTIALRAHVKAPTASAERGLGTGRPDEGFGLEISRTLAGNLLAMVDGGYTVIGRPAGVHYNNNWWYDVGIGQTLANGFVNVSVFFEEYRAIVPGLTSARDVLAAVSLTGASGWRLQAAGQFGLSDGAPDRAISLGASRRF